MRKNFALSVLLFAVALLFGFSLLQVSAQIRSRSEVFTDIHDYLSTVSEEVFKMQHSWPEDLKTGLDEIAKGLNAFKDSAAGDLSRMDQPIFLLHRK